MKRALLILVATLTVFAEYSPDRLLAAEMSRQEIRSLPITARPSRPGHFYGNTVRRAHSRRATR